MNRPLLMLAFFLSGASGLIFQTVWVRALTRYLGATTPALATVLGVFMAGLALGSALGGRIADRTRYPMRIYAVLEVGIAALGLLATFVIMAWVGGLYVALHQAVPDRAGLVLFGRVVFVALCLLPSTVLMGATLPLLTAFVTRSGQGLQTSLGKLYAINTCGALAGVLGTGFVLLGELGETACLFLAAGLNVVAAGLALALRAGQTAQSPVVAAEPTAVTDGPEEYGSAARRWALAAFFVSGFTALAYEILWTRLLVLVLETSIYAFASMLGLFLAGIAYGSWHATRRGPARRPLAQFGLLEIAIGCWTAVGLLLFPVLDPYYLPGTWDHFSVWELQRVWVAFIMVAPVAYLFGRQFPVAVRCCAGRGEGAGRLTGRAYAVNTLGTILGSLGTGFLLIPTLGVANTLVALAALNVVLGLVLLTFAPADERRPVRLTAAVLTASFLAAAVLVGDPYLRAIANRVRRDSGPEARILAYGEGVSATCIAAADPGRRDTYHLLVDGQGMTKLVTETKLITHLPYLLAKDPKRYLIICFGMGTTARSASLYPHLEIDAVDLVPQVFDYFPFYHADADKVRQHPGLRFHVNDGRNHLLVTTRTYDMITIDPAPPVHSAGTVNLYTQEFFGLAKSRLSPDGVFCMWLPPTQESELVRIMRTFTEVFPDGSIWGAVEYPGFYLTGGHRPIRPTPAERAELVRKLRQIDELGEWGNVYQDQRNLESLYLIDAAELAQLLHDVPVVTDDRPSTEFPLWRFLFSPAGRRMLVPDTIRDRTSAFWREREHSLLPPGGVAASSPPR
jgi:spermidine synthase